VPPVLLLMLPMVCTVQWEPLSMSGLLLLFESSTGYALFDVVKSEEISAASDQMQESITDLARFSKLVKLRAFQPFTTAESALENIMAVSEGTPLSPFLLAGLTPVWPARCLPVLYGGGEQVW
jgi:hypothetical protein